MNKETIPKSVLPYLEEIAHRLYANHAVVMIGAGFSKNAEPNEATHKRFPNWNELGDIFYKKLNGEDNSQNKKYLNVLKLAEEVEAGFDRNTLYQILKQEIPDKEYRPSSLHEKILALPWNDVFTTNYDTLLERAAETILSQRYETVVNTEDLVLSTKPRIIKLHGSFPSTRPFIITEEDYRTYPLKFAAFVNTVQQSLLENTLCLVGFSGDDPNFLKWIGWIRDNLGEENSPKIYLIGILNLSIGEQNILRKRNIISIDLSICPDVNNDHKKAIDFFVNFLSEEKRVDRSINWPLDDVKNDFDASNPGEIENQIIVLTERWKNVRQHYPNWIVLPESRRNKFLDNTIYSSIFTAVSKLNDVSSPNDIMFLFELDWRLKKSLMPIPNDWIHYYESISNSYNPFSDLLKEDVHAQTPQDKPNFIWGIITNNWIEIQLSILRFYREEGRIEQWNIINERLVKIQERLNLEQKSNLSYERCLYHLFSLDIVEFKKELDKWQAESSLPFWEAKRAGMYAEFGDIENAKNILETSLRTIRKKLSLSPIIDDYSAISQEAYILRHLFFIELNNSKSSNEFLERWSKFRQYNCDPDLEFKLFGAYLKVNPRSSTSEINYTFDIGRTTITKRFGQTEPYTLKCYTLLRFMEETGFPYRINDITFNAELLSHALIQIANYSPYWALACSIRLGDKKSIESIFGRKSIAEMSNDSIDNLVKKYLEILEQINNERLDNYAKTFNTILPEVLSRLCVKSSYDVKIQLLLFVQSLSNTKIWSYNDGMKKLIERLIMSFSAKEQVILIPQFMETNILVNGEVNVIDPFYFLDIYELKKVNDVVLNKSKIDLLFEISKKRGDGECRKAALHRLIFLHELNLLNQEQVEMLGEVIWYYRDKESGFPSDSLFSNFTYANYPYPNDINPIELLRLFIKNIELLIQGDNKKFAKTSGLHDSWENITGTYHVVDFQWNTEDFNLLIVKLTDWWDTDKKYLLKEDLDEPLFSTQKEFKSRFSNLISIISRVIAPNFILVDKVQSDNIFRIVNELQEYKMFDYVAKAALFEYFPEIEKEEIKKDFYRGIFSDSKEELLDVLNGLQFLIENPKIDGSIYISAICDNIKCQSKVDLKNNLLAVRHIIQEHPEMIKIEHLNSLEIGLSNLLGSLKLLPKDIPKDIDEKLVLKTSGAKLTVTLAKYFNQNKDLIPKYIHEWKESCIDKNEFSEIRRIWLDFE
ncbi:SIR2 family protein [Arcicella lustrica]|uniref:SIR2 family protein n=1 Tax=Arcicella lustrica TaxID=2984196 RepID=A0ABU5SP06_9BACT|nr:SIR2 family protein [Arcicella sp. DC25W]MEA5428679.1 SIR2 family protein [Arcicella sp. DC25W]